MPGPILFIFAVWLILFSISAVRLFKSFKKKILLQIIVYLVCFLVSGYAWISLLLSIIDNNKLLRESEKARFFHLKEGDAATMKGVIAFSCYDDAYKRQDSLYNIRERLDSVTLSYIFWFLLQRSIKEDGRIINVIESICITPVQFDQLRKYLDYQQQKRDTILYTMEIKVRRSDNRRDSWFLLDTIQTSAVKKMPPLIDSCE